MVGLEEEKVMTPKAEMKKTSMKRAPNEVVEEVVERDKKSWSSSEFNKKSLM